MDGQPMQSAAQRRRHRLANRLAARAGDRTTGIDRCIEGPVLGHGER
jgi:hypothetical protein